MDREAVRYRVISVLLQAGGPLTLPELVAESGCARQQAVPVLEELADEQQVIEGRLCAGKPTPQYCWWACWAREIERRTAVWKQQIRAAVSAVRSASERWPDIDSPSTMAFHDYVINEYKPPEDKRFLVFLQCSVRRPFSSSPSHASMRRGIFAATGYDPGADFVRCPVHAVVLASKVGPVPYELEDVYPANVRAGGVKHFSPEHFARAKPILAERMAQYTRAHGDNYDRIATFTEGRYGEVMAAARELSGVEFPILPAPSGPRVVRMGDSKPRKYWEKYWIQLYLEIVDWLPESRREEAQARLEELQVACDAGILPRPGS